MLRIGYDAKRLFNNFTGLGNYSRTLLKNLSYWYPDHAYFLFSPKLTKNSETHFFLNSPLFNVQTTQQKPRFYWRSFGVKKILEKHDIQLFHGLSHEIPIGIQKKGIKSVVTIHDLIFKRYPDQYAWADRRIYDWKFKYACQHADKIVAISESTKQDIVNFYQIDPTKIEVIYQSCHERFMQEKSPKLIEGVLQKYNLPEHYLLYVGSLIERKNLLGILQAYQHLSVDCQVPLLVIGEGRSYKEKILSYISQHQLSQKVIFLKPDFDDLPALYQQAQIFIYPSYFEGFGIPILEALFSQTPVITSNCSSLPEAAGANAYLIDPQDSTQIAHGIEKILSDETFKKNMIEKGYQHAQQFLGEGLTRQVMRLYETVVG